MKEARYTGIGLKSLCILTLRRCRLILMAALLGALLLGLYGGASYSGRQAAASEAREAALEDLQTQRDSLSDEMGSYKQNIKEAEQGPPADDRELSTANRRTGRPPGGLYRRVGKSASGTEYDLQ